MLGQSHEYEKMAAVEQEHWWYRTLHSLVLDSIRRNFTGDDAEIIDAGCGSGGLLLFLHKNGYTRLEGFDLSPDAVTICRRRALNVYIESLLNIAGRYARSSADIIISNDTLYYLNEQERFDFTRQCFQVLKPGGILICNVPALKAFHGIHDIAVGIKHRFSKRDVQKLFNPAQYQIVKEVYWPFLLSPIIFQKRLLQRIKMRMAPDFVAYSDIELPNPRLNNLLARVTLFENRWFSRKPFGISLFLVIRKVS